MTVKLVLVGMWWFTNLSEIGRSRYCLQPLGLRFILGYDENRIFLNFFYINEMHMPLGFTGHCHNDHVITGPSVLLWGLAWGFGLVTRFL